MSIVGSGRVKEDIDDRDDKLELSTGGEGHLNGNEDESLEEATWLSVDKYHI